MGGAGVCLVALDEGVLAFEEGEGLLVLGEVVGRFTVLADAGEVEAHLVDFVSFVDEVEEDNTVSPVVNRIGWGLLNRC